MSRPHVVVHTLVSVDGRTDHVAADVGLYYELAGRLPHDAVLTGSATLRSAATAEGIDLGAADAPPGDDRPAASTEAPLLVVVDSRGQLTRFDWLRAVPFWRDLLVACSISTPAGHLERLARQRVEHVVVGERRVDLAGLLHILARDHGLRHVRVDSGGALSGALLRAGLVDEISLMIGPYAVGGRSPASLFVADDLADDGVVGLELTALERLAGGVVWLRYAVTPSDR